jgi:hypothetical protein
VNVMPRIDVGCYQVGNQNSSRTSRGAIRRSHTPPAARYLHVVLCCARGSNITTRVSPSLISLLVIVPAIGPENRRVLRARLNAGLPTNEMSRTSTVPCHCLNTWPRPADVCRAEAKRHLPFCQWKAHLIEPTEITSSPTATNGPPMAIISYSRISGLGK